MPRAALSLKNIRPKYDTKARALAVMSRPVGNIAKRSIGGRSHSVKTAITSPVLSSRVNIHSEAMAKPISERTAARTPSAAVTLKPAGNDYGSHKIILPKSPDIFVAMQVNNGLMPGKILRHFWQSDSRKVRRCINHETPCPSQPASGERRVRQLPQSKRHIDAFLHQVNLTVV